MSRYRISLILFLICAVLQCADASAQGLMIPGIGARNRSFGGAAAGNSVDSAGALFFNPATMSQLPGNEVLIGAEIPFVREQTRSTGFGSSGSTDADVGIFPLSTIAIVYRPESTPDVTYGLGLFSAGGLFSNYPADPTNPVLQPPPPNGAGAGPLFSLLSLLQFIPAASVQVTDEFSIGGGPIVTLANLQLAPASLAPPDDANMDGNFTYPAATGTHPHYGLGFQIGAYYNSQSGVNVGFSYKSPNWLETIKVNAQDELGFPRPLQFSLDLPAVYSLGFSYTGWEYWTLAADVRYVDYDNVDTLSNSGFNADGSVRGVGWESVFSLSLGAMYELTDDVTLQLGWFVTENPVPDSMAAFNIGAPAYYRHLISAGTSWAFNEAIDIDFGYYFAPPSTITGPIQSPAGPVPDTAVSNTVSSHAILLNLRFKY